jgi:hypothetical protein
MTRYLVVLVLMATAAMGSAVGDTYQKVIEDNGKPTNEMAVGSMRILNYGNVTIKLRDDVVFSVKGLAISERPPEAPTMDELHLMPAAQQVAMINEALTRAVNKVTKIVNQPVQGIPLTPALRAGVWTDGWFHPGATKPDFNNVDVRKTQSTAEYAKFPYITSNLNPGVAFPGNEVEFNPMTKFFYQDRNFPKKRLSEEEMLEVNRLYRVIGQCAAEMAMVPKQ